MLIAVGETLTRRFLRLTGQKSTNPPASPGGKAEPGEPLGEAAARELKEETGLLVDPADLSLVHVVHVEQGWDRAGQFVLFAFTTDAWTGELTNAEPANTWRSGGWRPGASPSPRSRPPCKPLLRTGTVARPFPATDGGPPPQSERAPWAVCPTHGTVPDQ
ncbi:NUDIX domain-containing protein [Streptomyces sp. NPDC002490]|uniref:NUDIX domain-containing protein n=1 Tax=Streptomyces sp. NPDC002490 TaxID=3154416 RepID=UPI00333371DB